MDTRVEHVKALIASEPSVPGGAEGMVGLLQRLCAAAAKALVASGAGVSVMTEDGVVVVAAASGEASARVDELQFTLGEGPCTDAFASRRPVLEADLGAGVMARWPVYSAAAHHEGVRAVFAFPLQLGAARLGVLDLYRGRAGSLTDAELTEALSFAEVAMTTLLDGQRKAPHGKAAGGLDEALDYHAEVHQAQGMVMVQLGVSLAAALALLRAYAYADDRALGAVARDVVTRSLRLDQDNT
jgi:hypothetical protein